MGGPGNQRDVLMQVADELCIELGYAGDEEAPGAISALGGKGSPVAGILSPEDELLVARMRCGLAKLVAAVGAQREQGAVGAALDGAETVMRGELLRGNPGQLLKLMPSFVFLVVLPVVEQDEALELSNRMAKLVEGALRSG